MQKSGIQRAVSSFAAAIIVALLLPPGPALAETPPLTMKVFTSRENNLYTNYTVLIGERDMVLVDAPFSMSEAHRLVGELLEIGRNLTHVYVTHDHPDHFFAKEVITEAFPDAKVIAPPTVVEDIWRSIPFKIRRWGPLLGDNGPKYPTAPAPIEADHFELEGHRIEILGPMQGDHHHATALWVPSLKAMITGDLTFHGIHVWLGEHTAERRDAWIESLDRLMAYEPDVVVAGHKVPGLEDDPSSLAFTRQYIVDFSREAEKAKDSATMIARMQALYPDVIDVLDNFILPNSAQVGVGEVPPWEE